jgi:hypothetical protein
MKQTILLQRLEGALVLVVAALVYHAGDGNLLLFTVLLLAVDASMVGYLWGNRTGALVYNLGHSYTIPGIIAVILLAAAGHVPLLLFIWFAHIGLDRMLGYGLKESTGFRHTHLGTIGRG